jgi:putative transposase
MSGAFNLEPGDRVVVDGVAQSMKHMVQALREGDPDDIQFVDRTGRISTYTESEFLDLYNAGKLRILTRTERIDDRAPEDGGATARAHRRLKYLREFDANPVSKSEKPLAAFIERVAAQIGDTDPPSTGSVRRWDRTRGEPGIRRLREMTERYRPGPGRRLNSFADQTLSTELERYWDSPRVTPKQVWARVVRTIADKNAGFAVLPEHRIPNIAYSTVWRRCQTGMTFERARRRYGAKEAARRFKAIKGSLEAERLLDLAIMDHTDVDCWVIDDVTHQPIGRPRITFLIDLCSRYPLGFSIGWKSASLEAAVDCLRHALPKKVNLRANYPEIEHEWLAYGQPREILVDQGLEFVGSSFEDICADLGISIRIAPVRTPEYKGAIERFIGTFNRQALHPLQGSVPGKPQALQALGINPEKDAIFFLSELEALVNKWIVDVYARETHRTLNAAPAKVWLDRRKTDPIELCPDLNALNAACSKVVKRVLTRGGVELNNLTYRSEAVSGLLEDLRPRAKKRNVSAFGVEVKAKYHSNDLGHIYVWNQVKGEYVKLPCTKLKYADGLGEHHHGKIREWANETNREFTTEADMCRARVELHEMMDTIVADKVRDRKRLQRLRHPERQLVADRVRISTVDDSRDGSSNDIDAIEVLIDPLRNRTGGDELHPRRLLNGKRKSRVKARHSPLEPKPASVVDLRNGASRPLANFDFDAEVAAARVESEGLHD